MHNKGWIYRSIGVTQFSNKSCTIYSHMYMFEIGSIQKPLLFGLFPKIENNSLKYSVISGAMCKSFDAT